MINNWKISILFLRLPFVRRRKLKQTIFIPPKDSWAILLLSIFEMTTANSATTIWFFILSSGEENTNNSTLIIYCHTYKLKLVIFAILLDVSRLQFYLNILIHFFLDFSSEGNRKYLHLFLSLK